MDSLDFFGSSSQPVIVGHRGDPEHFPDNSLAGIRSGLAAVGRCEVDVRRSADGVLVLAHDSELAGAPIHRTEWATLAALDVGDGHRPARLADALAVDGALDIEIKNLPGSGDFDPNGEVALAAALRARPQDVLSSFHWPDMDRVRRHHARVRTGLLVARTGDPEVALKWASANRHAFVAPHESLITARLVDRARGSDVAVVAWTVNDPDRFEELARLGVAAIITDRPGSIRRREEEA